MWVGVGSRFQGSKLSYGRQLLIPPACNSPLDIGHWGLVDTSQRTLTNYLGICPPPEMVSSAQPSLADGTSSGCCSLTDSEVSFFN